MRVSLGGKGGRIVRSFGAEKVTPLTVLADGQPDVEAEIARVAEAHAPENGYGETAWNADSKTVYWVSADWTSSEEHDAAYADFLAIDGVDDVTGDAEAALPSGEGWAQVWPESHLPRPTEAATPSERWSRLIDEMEATGELDREAPPPVVVAAPEPPSPLEQAFAMMGKLVEATANRPAPPPPVIHVHTGDNDPEQAFSTMQAMVEAFATRAQPLPPTVNVQPATAPDVHVHPAEVSVSVPERSVDVHVPAQEAPRVDVDVHVPEARVPDVHVQVEAPNVQVEAPHVHVAPARPDVHVTVEQPRPAAVRMEIGEDGTRRFVPEEDAEIDRE